MAIIRPFRALRPPTKLVAAVASPPYDVIDTREARVFAANNPHSFLHVTRPEIDLPEGTDEHADEVYEQGRRKLQGFIDRGTLIQDLEPRLYVYAQRMGQHRQVGLVACASVADYDQNVIKKHEKTRQDKEDDRTRHIQTLGAHDEPVFLTYRAMSEINALVSEIVKGAPTYDFSGSDQVQHTLWVVDSARTAGLVDLFATVDTLFVADGHHRSASASRVHRELGGQPGEHDVFMAVLFPHDQMQILAYNRLVRDLRRRDPAALLAEFRRHFIVTEHAEAAPREPLSFGLFLGDQWYGLRVRPGTYDQEDPVARLDASICQEQILDRMFGITDPRRDKNVDFVGGIRGTKELERRVREDGFSLALHLYPTSIEQLMAVSDANRLMPPKSTWFEPKLRSGLFVHQF